MKTLSAEREQQIIDAVKEAVDKVDGGADPTAVFTKIAGREGWGPHLLRFAAHAYNTGRQTAQREAHDDSLGKFAAFELADPEEVISTIYPPAARVKAAAMTVDRGVSAEYSRRPTWVADRLAREKLAVMRKEAAASAKTTIRPAEQVTAPSAYGRHLMFKAGFERARGRAAEAYDKLEAAMSGLATYFTRSPQDRVKFAEARLAAAAYHGDAGMALMEWVRGAARVKDAEARETPTAAPVARDAHPYDMIGRCVKLAAEVNHCRDDESRAAVSLEKHAIEVLAPFVAAPRVLKLASDLVAGGGDELPYYDTEDLRAFLPHLPSKAAAAPPAPDEDDEGEDSLLKGAGAFWNASIAEGLKRTLAKYENIGDGGAASQNTQRAFLDLEDPNHESDLRSVRSRAVLADLMNDDVIGGEPHERVLKAYNELSHTFPRSTTHPLVMRAMLRRHLQAPMDPHEVSQMGGLDTNIMSQYAQPPEQLQPLPPKPPPPPKPEEATKPPKLASDLYLLDDETDADPNSILS